MGKCDKIIKLAEEEGYNLLHYIDNSYNEAQASCVLSGLRKGIDPTPYCDKSYSLDKMVAIKSAIVFNVDYSEILQCDDNPIEIGTILNNIIPCCTDKNYENLANEIIIAAVNDIRCKDSDKDKDRNSAKLLFTKGTKEYKWCNLLTKVNPDYIRNKLINEGVW